MLARAGSVLLGVWLVVVLLGHFGALKLTGLVADLALVTVLAVFAHLFGDLALRPLFGISERSNRVFVLAVVAICLLFTAGFYVCLWTHGGWCQPSTRAESCS